MAQKNQSNKEIANKGQVHTYFGQLNLLSIRNRLNPVFTFNMQSTVLMLTSIIFFLTSTNNQLINYSLFSLLLSFDLLLTSLILKPIKYSPNGYEVTNSDTFKQIIFNYDLSESEITNFLKFFLPRIVVYGIISVIYTNINNKDLLSYRLIYFLGWSLTFSVFLLLLFSTLLMIGIGLLLDDYLHQGTTHRALADFRLEISKSALELDKLISKINNSQSSVVNKDYRKKIAGTLYKLRNFLVIEDQHDKEYTPELKIRFQTAEKEYSQELLSDLRKDKCVICYSRLENAIGPFLVCPLCGQGGHKNHIEEWFNSKTSCPVCKNDLSASSFLLIN